MSQRTMSVGTTPTLLANGRTNRNAITVSMLPSSTASGNTGTVYILKGSAPTATVGSPVSGDPVTQGSQWAEVGQYAGDPSVFQGQLWAVADTANQVLIVDETYSG